MRNKDPKGYYAILGVGPDADAAALKAAYRRRAMELHPDRNGRNGRPDTTADFQRLNEAYAVLGDGQARADYDAMAAAAEAMAAAAAKRREQGARAGSGSGAGGGSASGWHSARETPRPIVCSCCGKVSAQPRFAIYLQTKSFLFVTSRSAIEGIFCSACADRKALKASMTTWLLGWWGVPWGPIYTIQALWRNLLGGMRPALDNARLATHQASFFAATGRADMAHAVALDALGLARKIPGTMGSTAGPARAGVAYAEEVLEGEKLRVQLHRLLDSLGSRTSDKPAAELKDAWRLLRRPFFVQAAIIAVLASCAWYGVALLLGTAPALPSVISEQLAAVEGRKEAAKPEVEKPEVEKPVERPTDTRSYSWLTLPSLGQTKPKDTPAPAATPAPAQSAAPAAAPPSPPAGKAWVRPSLTPMGKPWPTRAAYLSGYPRENMDGLSAITIDNGRNESDVYVKLVSLDGAAGPVRFFYIPPHSRFVLESVTSGRYQVRYLDLRSGGRARSEVFALEETKLEDAIRSTHLTMALYPVRPSGAASAGNALARPADGSEDDF